MKKEKHDKDGEEKKSAKAISCLKESEWAVVPILINVMQRNATIKEPHTTTSLFGGNLSSTTPQFLPSPLFSYTPFSLRFSQMPWYYAYVSPICLTHISLSTDGSNFFF